MVAIPNVHSHTFIQNDLRPISLLPTVAKVLEGIVKDWLMPSVDPLLDENQFGCRPGRSTTHTLIAVLHKWIVKVLDAHQYFRCLI